MTTSASISLPEKAVMISAIAADVRLKDSDVRVAVVLLFKFHNTKEGKCFPSYETIAQAAGCGRRTAIRAVERLKQTGWLAVAPGHAGYSNRYAFPTVVTAESLANSPTDDTPDTTVVTPASPGWCHPSHPTSDPDVTQTHEQNTGTEHMNGTHEGPPQQQAFSSSPPAGGINNGVAGEPLTASTSPVGRGAGAAAKSPPRKKPAVSKGTRLSVDWQPSDGDLEYARNLGMPESMIEREATKFKNYWLGVPGSKGVKLDWSHTWANWCIRSIEFAASNHKARANTTSAMIAALQERGSV
jgi:hypothetical protein